MRRNLIDEMARRRVSVNDVAALLRIHRNSVSNKLYGKSDFTLTEALLLADAFFPDRDLRTLFRAADGEARP